MKSELFQLKNFDEKIAKQRCLQYRRRILDISQTVSAMHVAPAFSCLEITDLIYHDLMRYDEREAKFLDTFVMSKGHGCLIQYVILETFDILTAKDIAGYCKPEGKLGAHPDYGVSGIAASTGSLGHGMGIATGMAYADKLKGDDAITYVVLSDGEFQEGSTWEAMMMAANLKLNNLVCFLDLNDFGGLARMSEGHPAFYPLIDKIKAFGFEAIEVDGHDSKAIYNAVQQRQGEKPLLVIGKTTKGKGVSYMENVPIWHYRSPNPAEYQQALNELDEVSA
jgi:transketolase